MPTTADPTAAYWTVKLEAAAKALKSNNFDVSIHQTLQDAARCVLETIIPQNAVRTVGFGGSKTLADSGLLDMIKNADGPELMDSRDPALSPEQVTELRRQMLLADLYLASSNAVTMDGKLLNLDRTGNRVGAMHFGPHKVALLVGRNKLCETPAEAHTRVKQYASPVNAVRLGLNTPCTKTAMCMDCKNPQRICSVWTTTEKSFPAGRIHVLLVNSDEGF